MSTTRAVLSNRRGAARHADHASAREQVLTKIHSDDFVRATASSFEIPSARMLADEDEEDRSGGAKDAAAPRNDLVKFRDGYLRSDRSWRNFFRRVRSAWSAERMKIEE